MIHRRGWPIMLAAPPSCIQQLVRAAQQREERAARRRVAHGLTRASDRELAEWLGHRTMVPPEAAVLMGLGDACVGEWLT